MPERDPTEFRPHRRDGSAARIVFFVLAAIAIAGAAWWWFTQRQPAAPIAPPVASAPQPDAAPAPPAAPVATGPQFPIDAAAEPPPGDLDAQALQALIGLLGQPGVSSFLLTDGFARRFVATVDNLPREQASARMWPVQPTPQRFSPGAANASRYAPFVAFVEKVDAAKATAVYVQLYPQFQKAYEELGYPKGYFNDRLVAVIDHLLQAPEPVTPPELKLTEVKGEYAAAQPWTRYEFADPALQSLSAGQKTMVRMGTANERRLKAKLAEFRRGVTGGAVPKAGG